MSHRFISFLQNFVVIITWTDFPFWSFENEDEVNLHIIKICYFKYITLYLFICLHLMKGNKSDSSLNSHQSARCGTYWGKKGSKKKVWLDGSRKFQSAAGIERNKNSVSTLVFILFFSSNGCWILHVRVCVCVCSPFGVIFWAPTKVWVLFYVLSNSMWQWQV